MIKRDFQADELSKLFDLLMPQYKAAYQKYFALSRELNEEESMLALTVGVAEPSEIRIALVEKIVLPDVVRSLFHGSVERPNTTQGLCLNNLIVVRRVAYSHQLLKHELRHAYQWSQEPSEKYFLNKYFGEILEHGYCNSPLEVDARMHQA